MSSPGQSRGCSMLALVLAALVFSADAQHERPSAAYAPLYTGLIKFTDVPVYGTPEAPPIIQPTGRKRRNANFPAAPELSTPVLERLYSGVDGSNNNSLGQRRRLQQQQQARRRRRNASSSEADKPVNGVVGDSNSNSRDDRMPAAGAFDYAAEFAASYSKLSAGHSSSSSHGAPAAAAFDYAAAFAASYLASSGDASSSKTMHGRRLQQQQPQRNAQELGPLTPASSSSSSSSKAGHSHTAPFDYAAAFAASYTTSEQNVSPAAQRRTRYKHSTGTRRLHEEQQQQPFDYTAAFAASYTTQAAGATSQQRHRARHAPSSSSSSGSPRRLQEQHQFDYAAAFAASYTDVIPRHHAHRQHITSSSSSSSSSNGGRRRLQQAAAAAPAAAKQRPGWTGLWWADAGGVGVAAGPTHAIHTISTAMALYTLDPATGLEVESRTVSLQDLFAPVGAANCKEGVYDAIPMYDKHAKRYLLAATCGGKGAVLLAATATPDPSGPWFLFMLLADAAQTGMACVSPPETAIADSVRLTYDANGVYLSLFNYCPSNPATQGATILALPKHKVYKGAPNFVYGVFSADQILASMPPEQRKGLSAASFKQCAAAPPQLEADAAGSAAYLVCDHIGPDVSPRGNFTLLAIVNTGALWQFVGTRDTSPTPFLAARLVSRGGNAPLVSTVQQQQPERGSSLQAGGVKPTGFWSGSAVLSGGQVYAVDRMDVTRTPDPPATPVTLPSLMWSEVAVQVSMSGAGDCTQTQTWGTNWDWTRDWSVDWGRDFDKEWKDNKNDADAMKGRVEDLEDAIRKNNNCSATGTGAAGGGGAQQELIPLQQPVVNQVSDGSVATTDGRSGGTANCSAVAAGVNSADVAAAEGGGSGAAALPTNGGGRRLTERVGAVVASGTGSVVVSAWLAARDAATCRHAATELMLRPLQLMQEEDSSVVTPAWLSSSFSLSSSMEVSEFGREDGQQFEEETGEGFEGFEGFDEDEDAEADAAMSAGGGVGASRRLSQASLGGFIGFDVGCWYCYYGKGFYYSSSWFYKYWYTRNAWGFGWYRRYKRNYAPGWSRPSKFIGRHLLQEEQQHEVSGHRHRTRRLQQAADGGQQQLPPIPATQLQNETIVIPPCLLSSTYYKNTCKQCNYSRAVVKLTATPMRRGLLNYTSSANPLGFTAPTIAVTPGGTVVVIASYSGPNNHPNSSAPAYPGVGSFTIPPGAQGLNATWRVLRTGVGKVKSPSGRWSDYSTASVSLISGPSPSTTAQLPTAGGELQQPSEAVLRVHYGVQWAQREVECAADETEGEFEFEPQCAMPTPWIGVLTMGAT